MGLFMTDITYEKVQEVLKEDSVVVLPIGGGSKEHGNHLPMGTDYYVTDWIARRVTERCNVITLPTLPYAYFPAFVEWKGSVSINYDNFINYVNDILMSFIKFGVKKFLIIDGGVSTHPPLILLSQTLNNKYDVKVAVSDIRTLAIETERELLEQKTGGHGDESETSCMLYIKEPLVHMDKAEEEYTRFLDSATPGGITKVYVPNRMVTPHGINGNSKLATKEKGEKIMNAMVDALADFLEEFTVWRPQDIV